MLDRDRTLTPRSSCCSDVEAHPEHRKFVFPERPSEHGEQQSSDEPAGLYDKNGRLKHPERSVYYDPVFNPFGAPPPGMPYREKRTLDVAQFFATQQPR